MFRRLVLFLGLFWSAILSAAPGVTLAAEELAPKTAPAAGGWVVKDSMKPLIKGFNANADELDNFRNFDIPNEFIYIEDSGEGPLLPIYDLIACIKLTNPEAEIVTGLGDSFNISIDSVAFAKGSWPVKIYITKSRKIRDFRMVSVYIMEALQVGATSLEDADQRIAAVRMMTRACLAD